MATKKAKYKPVFPAGRIKKIMRTDEEVGKVAAAAPICVSKALELFIKKIVTVASSSLNGDKKITPLHL